MLLACVQTAGSVSMKRLNRLVKRTCANYAGWSAYRWQGKHFVAGMQRNA